MPGMDVTIEPSKGPKPKSEDADLSAFDDAADGFLSAIGVAEDKRDEAMVTLKAAILACVEERDSGGKY